ncbi:MAG: hypothetical protein WD075_06815 [Rhodospirillales bacterium]
MNDGPTKIPSGVPPQLVNPDGTTNWKVVFEDPGQGILAAVASVQSSEQMRSVMTSVALLLFKRKRDAIPRAEFMNVINRVLDVAGDERFEAAKTRIIGILDAEKQLRITKAALHVKNKETSQSVERRRRSAQEGFLVRLFNNPVYLTLVIGGVFILILIAVLGVYQFSLQSAGDKAAQPADEKQVAKTEPDSQDEPTKTASESQNKPAETAYSNRQIHMVALQPFQINIGVNGSRKRMTLVPLIGIKQGDKITPVCSLAPRLNESILFHMREEAEQGGVVDRRRTNQVSARVLADINARSDALKINRLLIVDARELPSKIVLSATKGCERVSFEKLP